MTLSIVGKESLDTLQRWAEGMFAPVSFVLFVVVICMVYDWTERIFPFADTCRPDETPPNTQQNCNNTPTQVPTRKGARLSELEPWRYPSGDSNVRVVWFGLCHAHTRPAQSFFVSHPYPHTNQTNTTLQHTQPPPFLPSAFGKALLVAPVQPLRRLQLTWVVPFKARFI